jgi:hypothetical protein
MKGGAVDEIQALRSEVFKLEQWRQDMLARVERMTRTMQELRTSKFTIGGVLMRYPDGNYFALQVIGIDQTDNGQVITVAPTTNRKRLSHE